MSFSDAISQVDQILQWQQQITNPDAATATGALATTAGLAAAGVGQTTPQAGATSGTQFADALAQAQLTGTDGSSSDADGTSVDATDGDSLLGGGDSALLQLLASMSGTAASPAGGAVTTATTAVTADGGPSVSSLADAGTTATSADDPRISAMANEANDLLGKPYVWGGGHSNWGTQDGYDCSGFVSAVLHAGGYLTTPQDTETLPGASGIDKGPGQYVTIYDRSDAGADNDHVIIDIGGQFYESGGEHGAWGGGGGVEKIATPSAAYLSTFNDVLHPAGL